LRQKTNLVQILGVILSFKEFPAYNGGIPYLIWDDKGVTTVGFSL